MRDSHQTNGLNSGTATPPLGKAEFPPDPLLAATAAMRQAGFSAEHTHLLNDEILQTKAPAHAAATITAILKTLHEKSPDAATLQSLVSELGTITQGNKALGNDLIWACETTRLQNSAVPILTQCLTNAGFKPTRDIDYDSMHGYIELPLSNLVAGEVQCFLLDAFRSRGTRHVSLAPVEPREILEAFAPGLYDYLEVNEVAAGRGQSTFEGLVLKRDHTFSMINRVITDRKNLQFPFVATQIDHCQRAEALRTHGKESLRGFIQADYDLFDTRPLEAAEKINQDVRIIKDLNAMLNELIGKIDGRSFESSRKDPEIMFRISSRKLMEGALIGFGIPEPQVHFVIVALDATKSFTLEQFRTELPERLKVLKVSDRQKPLKDEIVLSEAAVDFIWQLCGTNGASQEIVPALRQLANLFPISTQGAAGLNIFDAGIEELRGVLEKLERDSGILCYGDAGMKRTCPIYSGFMFEGTLRRNPEAGSVVAGGRYDEIAGKMAQAQGVEGFEMSCVGGAIGVSRIANCLVKNDACRRLSSADILVTVRERSVTAENEGILEQQINDACTNFRDRGLRALFFDPEDSVDDGALLHYAQKNKIPLIYFADRELLMDVEADSMQPCTPGRVPIPEN